LLTNIRKQTSLLKVHFATNQSTTNQSYGIASTLEMRATNNNI